MVAQQQPQAHPPAARSARFKHIVFGFGTFGVSRARRRRAINLAPPPAIPPPLEVLPDPRGRHGCKSLTAEEEQFIVWLFRRAGLDARRYRPETLRRRLAACLRVLHVRHVEDARNLIDRDPSLVSTALGALVIGVTSFFRDSTVFDHLTYTALPSLSRSPRIWSAGCSDGEELYSVAILLAEMNMLHRCYLLGSDCRPQAVAAARAGRYDAAATREVPLSWKLKYFDKIAGGFQVRQSLRAAAQWRTSDVTQVHEPGAWDLILCRNMAMYFRAGVAAQVWQAMETSLRPGGFLVLGKAERPAGATRLSAIAPCIYRRDRG